MTDLNKIIAGSKSIEHLLTTQFGGSGKGMREKLDSSRYPIPLPLRKRISHLAHIRNCCVHEQGYDYDDTDGYLRKCEEVCDELTRLHAIVQKVAQQRDAEQAVARQQAAQQQAAQQQATREWKYRQGQARMKKHRRDRLKFRLGAGALVLAGAWWLLRPAPEPAPDAASATTASVEQQSDRAAAPQHGARNGAKQAPAAAKRGKTAAHVGLGNDVLALESVEFSFRKDSFDRLEPRLMVTVRNLSDRTISSARLDGRMYIGDEASPAIDTSAGGWHNDPLYLFFGDSGLAPGAHRKLELYLSSDDRWKLPDIVNAGKRQVLLRVKEVEDGRKQAFGKEAQAWPAVESGARAAAPHPATPSIGADEYRRRFLAGEHVALSDSRLDIDKLEVRLQDDGFGRKQPYIGARFTNRSGVTLSNATLRVQLFIKGESTPLADSKAGFSPDNVYAFFGGKGLADGASSKQELGAPSRGNWDAPDLINAIRAGRAQLVLRLESISDGRDRDFKSKATEIRDL